MFLLLHNKDRSTLDFINYLKLVNANFLDISTEQLIQEVSVIDKLNANECDCIWKLNGIEIKFAHLSGIFNRIFYFEIEHFEDYIEEDRMYVQSEWWAYYAYRINKTQNTINNITKEIMSGLIYQFPFIYAIAKSCGFSVPFYVFSTDRKWLQSMLRGRRITARKDLTLNFDFRESTDLSKNDIGFIEYIEGLPIILHYICGAVIGCIKVGDKYNNYAPSNEITQMCIQLGKLLNMSVLELILKEDIKSKVIYFYHISIFPNFTIQPELNRHKKYSILLNKLSVYNR